MKISNLICAAALSLSATVASAATILQPTDGDVNFLAAFGFISSGYSLAIFNDNAAVNGTTGEITSSGLDVMMSSTFLADGGVINFIGVNSVTGIFQADNGVDPAFDLDSTNDNFIVGLSANGGANWYADVDSGLVPANSAALHFQIPQSQLEGGNVLAVDVRIVPAVPVPAAAWLFGSGLIGLVGVARRRA